MRRGQCQKNSPRKVLSTNPRGKYDNSIISLRRLEYPRTPRILTIGHDVDTRGSRHLVFTMVQEPYIQHLFEEGPLFYYQRYEFGVKVYSLGKVLGTQNHPTLRLASFHCFLYLNPIKGTFNIASILTHTRIHLTINMASIIQKPNHSSIIAYHHPSIHQSHFIQGSKHITIRQHQEGINIKQIPNIQAQNHGISQAYSSCS